MTRRRAVVCLVGVALAVGAALGVAGCGGNDGSPPLATPTTTATPTLTATLTATLTTTPTPTPTPTPSHTAPSVQRPWAFLGTHRIMTAFTPTDLDLYRSILPVKFDMPDQPLMVVAVAHYYDVTLPLVPYREGYVLLQCKYRGRAGLYTITMPVDDKTANDGGRAIGFNKYVADTITLEEHDDRWIGRVLHAGRTVMDVTFTGAGEPTTGGQDNTVLFNLLPPGVGPQVLEVNSSPSGDQTTVTTQGSAIVKADPSEPWAGLLSVDGRAVWAVFQEVRGDSVLTWSNLE